MLWIQWKQTVVSLKLNVSLEHLKLDQSKLYAFVRRWEPPSDLFLSVSRMGVRWGWWNGHLPPWKLVKEPKIYRKPEASSLIPINWFNSCNQSLFAGMTLTLHKSQVHCSGVMQWWACSSLISASVPAEVVAKFAKGLFYRGGRKDFLQGGESGKISFHPRETTKTNFCAKSLTRKCQISKPADAHDCWSLLSNNLATNLWRFTSSYGSKRCFAAFDCWTQTSWQVMQRASGC